MTEYTAKKVILKDAAGNYLIPYTEKELPEQTNNSGKYLTTDGTQTSWNELASYHPPLLTPQWFPYLVNDLSWLRADTFSWQNGTTYQNVYNLLVNEYNNSSSVTETDGSITFKRTPRGLKIALASQEVAIANKYTSDGVAMYFILDTENTKFKLPRTKYGFEGLRTNVGDDIAESLPNIKGSITLRQPRYDLISGLSGAITATSTSVEGVGSGGANVGSNITFNASNSSSIYQDNAPVQERATQMYLYFYVGEFSETATEQTAGLNSELLNKKVDIDNLTEIVVLKATYVSGTSICNIYSNGYCEQMSRTGTLASNAVATITLAKAYKNDSYNITLTPYYYGGTSDGWNENQWVYSPAAGSFSVYNSADAYGGVYWKTCGYLPEGTY